MSNWLSERQRTGGIDEIPLPAGTPGRLWLCGKRAIADGQFSAPDRPWNTVVCLCRRPELEHRYPEYVSWLDGAGDPAASVWWPIPDLGARPVAEYRAFVDDLVARLAEGDRLLVHCAAGMGRAGTTAVAILVRMGDSVAEASAVVRAARPGAGPEAGSQRHLVEAIAAPD